MFKIYASGDSNQLNIFLDELKSNPRYNVALETKQYYDAEHKRGKVVLCVKIQPLKPVTVSLRTKNGEQINIDFLNSTVIELDKGVYVISGKTVDIFS